MGGVSWYKLVVYILLSAKRRAYFCKSIAIEMRGVSRYISEVSGSGVDSTLLRYGVKISKIPSFIVKNGHETPPPKRWGFSCFNVSSSFISLPFSAIVSLLSLCSLTLSSLKMAHPVGLEANFSLVSGECPTSSRAKPRVVESAWGLSESGVARASSRTKR